jgi:uncharacterized OB-fold protein
MTDELDLLPEVNSDTEPWWAATRECRLLVQRCRACGRFQHYPRYLCVHCSSTDLEFVDASGSGRVYSFTVVHRAPSTAFKTPYVVALVRLAEGPLLLTNIVGPAPGEVRCDMAVTVAWTPLSDGRNLPVFKPSEES